MKWKKTISLINYCFSLLKKWARDVVIILVMIEKAIEIIRQFFE